ncbi:cannabinoid receptor 1-like [Actinia tenebrosa]|uniref:Cannabinoid receptor 1-like n=1 Tax=Actinia tenebrosa TaxID=6105 RepID=A0A6P8J677_ACTTE|nr:cannabinoid receptor 1-like [Actinia tenebrosa]
MNYSCFFGSIALNRPDYRIVMILLYVITGIPAIILNSLVLYSIWKTPLLHKPSYILLASLALSDLLNGSFGQQHTVSPSNESKLATNIDINVAKYRKSLKTMLLIFVVLILFYFPYVTSAIGSAVVLAANKASPSKGIKTTIYQFITSCELLAFVNSTVNPLMYLCRMRDIRKAVVAVVKGIFPRKRLTKENTVSIQDE